MDFAHPMQEEEEKEESKKKTHTKYSFIHLGFMLLLIFNI